MLIPFYVRTSRLGEDIQIRDHRYSYSRAGIFCEFLNSSNPFSSDAYNALLRFLNRADISTSSIHEITQIKEYIDALPLSPLLKAILLWQPANEAAQEDAVRYAWADYSGYEKYLNDAILYPEYAEEQSNFLRHHSPLCWNEFVSVLSGSTSASFTKPQIEALLSCFSRYCHRLLDLFFYLRRLFLHLENYDSLSSLQTEDLLKVFTSQTFSEVENAAFFDEKKNVKYSPTYEAASLQELLAIEVQECGIARDKLIRCKQCQNFFLRSRKNSTYCSMPNPRFNGKSCSEAVSLFSLIRQTSELPMQALFTKSSKTYAKWCRENDIWCREKLGHLPEEEKKSIIDNMYVKYEDWKSFARFAQNSFAVGYITEDALLDALTIPSVFDRSPELAKWKRILRKRN